MHLKPSLIAAFVLWTSPALAEFPALTFTTPAAQIGQRADAPAQYAFPIAAFDGTSLPSRLVTGVLDQRAFRLDGWRDNTLALLQPLRAQLEKSGYRVIFDCATTACGGFDFRFGMDILPEPQMHVDLGDFRYLVAERAEGEVVSLLVSTAPDQGFVQVTSVTPGSVVPDTGPTITPTTEQLPVTKAEIAAPAPEITTPEPQAQGPAPKSGSLASQIDLTGSAPLDDLVFASGKAVLAEGDYASLIELAAWLKAHPELKVTLVGHTDASGSLAGNTALSRQRAAAVRDWLIQRLGVDKAQLDAQGAGYLAPRASNQTPEGRQKNRRVEVMLTSTPVR